MFVVVMGWLGGCQHTEPVAPARVEAPATLPTRVRFAVPETLTGEQALQMALLEADLGELDGIVVEMGRFNTPGHDYALTDGVIEGTVRFGPTLDVEICAEDCARLGEDRDRIAAALGTTWRPEMAWKAPEMPSRKYAMKSAAIAYELAPLVIRRRIGSKYDPVARAPREPGATPIVDWLQGRRDLRIGRLRHGAEAFDRAFTSRKTARSRADAVAGYHSAGWTVEAWELTETLDSDLRTAPLLGHVALAKDRNDVARTVIEQLPTHAERDRLQFHLSKSEETLAAWRSSDPEGSWNDAVDYWIEQDNREALLELVSANEAPEGLRGVPLGKISEHIGVLERELHEAERLNTLTSRAQNAFGDVRRDGRIPCDSPVRVHVEEAETHGAQHREHVENARHHWSALEVSWTALPTPVGRQTPRRVNALETRLGEQLRATKVLRTYQQRVLLKSCEPTP